MRETINVILRLHAPAGMRRLSAALFSVFAQIYPSVQPVVVLQAFSPADIAGIQGMIRQFPWLPPKHLPIVLNVNVPPGDHRSKLLNEGLRACEGRYLAFLDYDDVLYRHAYSYLVQRLERTNTVIAFARVYRKEFVSGATFDYHLSRSCPFEGRSRLELFQSNFCPLHSYLLDRAAIAAEDLWFDEALTRLEDYAFLLRICAKYPSDFSGLDKFIGEYFVRTGGSISELTDVTQNRMNDRPWFEAMRQVQQLKSRLVPQLTMQELLQLKKVMH